MSTPKKARKGNTKVTVDLLAHMDELRILGLKSKKIAPIMNISESTAKRYLHILESIQIEQDFDLAGDLNWGAIIGYCQKIGKRIPANLHGLPEPEPPDFVMKPEQPKPDLPAILEDIASALYELAEYIENHKEG